MLVYTFPLQLGAAKRTLDTMCNFLQSKFPDSHLLACPSSTDCATRTTSGRAPIRPSQSQSNGSNSSSSGDDDGSGEAVRCSGVMRARRRFIYGTQGRAGARSRPRVGKYNAGGRVPHRSTSICGWRAQQGKSRAKSAYRMRAFISARQPSVLPRLYLSLSLFLVADATTFSGYLSGGSA